MGRREEPGSHEHFLLVSRGNARITRTLQRLCYNTRMSTDLAALLRHIPGYNGQIAHTQPLSARPATFAEPAAPLPEPLAHALAARGLRSLYQHQAAAVDAARRGEHIGVVTATASGKTLCYQLPTLEAVLGDPANRAIYLFPTKALAHDQLRSLQRMVVALSNAEHRDGELAPVIVATLDGDTPRAERDTVRARAQIILSNPDMLHRTVLPDHRRWQALLARLRYVVLDEAHTYRGVFGSHVALVLRRLRRLCAHYGAAPQFICCSATSANPQEHLAALVGRARDDHRRRRRSPGRALVRVVEPANHRDKERGRQGDEETRQRYVSPAPSLFVSQYRYRAAA